MVCAKCDSRLSTALEDIELANGRSDTWNGCHGLTANLLSCLRKRDPRKVSCLIKSGIVKNIALGKMKVDTQKECLLFS